MRLSRLAALAWKDLLEAKRDWKTLVVVAAAAWLLPLVTLLTSGLQAASIVHVVVADLDCGNATVGNVTFSSRLVASEIAAGIRLIASNVVVEVSECSLPHSADVIVVLPPGFTRNLTSMEHPAVIIVRYKPGSSAARMVYTLLTSIVVPAVSRLEARSLVEALGALAGIRVSPEAVLDPIRVETGFIGVPEGLGEEIAAGVQAARQLAFAIIFVLAPAAILASDAVIGEKERRNLELLFSTPVSPSELIAAKMLAAGLISAAAGLSDAASTLVYLWLAGGATPLRLNAALVAVHVASTMLAIMATAALTILAVMLGAPSRLASLLSGVYTVIAFFVYTASLTVDYTRLPLAYQALLALIPYTYSVNAVLAAARLDVVSTLANLAALAGYTLGVVLLAARLASLERMVRSL